MKKREIDKIGYTRVVSEQNRVTFFSRRGALTHVCKTPPKRVLAPEPTTPCVRAAPQTVFSVNSANDGAQKVLSTNNPILFRNTPGIPCPVLRFYKPPDFFHTAPDFVHTAQRKIFHTTGKLPTVTTVMQPQQHC